MTRARKPAPRQSTAKAPAEAPRAKVVKHVHRDKRHYHCSVCGLRPGSCVCELPSLVEDK